MPKKPRKSIMIDTSFLITVFDPSRKNHDNAKKYYKYFIANNIDMYLSVIAVAEYQVKASIDSILKSGNFLEVNYTSLDAITTGEFSAYLQDEKPEGSTRTETKDDIKLLAQCANSNYDFIATDDSSILAKYCRRLYNNGKIKTKVITMDVNEGQLALDFSK